MGFSHFSSSESFVFWNIKFIVQVLFSWNIRSFLGVSVLKYKFSRGGFIFQASAEKCRVPFPEMQEMLSFHKMYEYFPQREVFNEKISIFFMEKFWGLRFKSAGFCFRKYKNFFILELESYISWNIRNFFRGKFFLFFGGVWDGKWPR